MQHQKGLSPALRDSAEAGLDRSVCLEANFDQDLTTHRLLIERLQRRLGVSATLASAIAGLAGLGPVEVRS